MTRRGRKKGDPQEWFLYIVRCAGGELYTGVANDVARRFAEHCAQGKRCAKFLRGKAPLKLVFVVGAGSRSDACRLEAALKKLDRRGKLEVAAGRTALACLKMPNSFRIKDARTARTSH